MNPLDTPWGHKEPEKDTVDVPTHPRAFRGVRIEAVTSDADAEDRITISVQGINGVPSGSWELRYIPGMSLGKYLARLKLKHAAVYAAVYDQNNLSKGRLRLSYVPTLQSRILIARPQLGQSTQRSEGYNAENLARDMGKRATGKSQRVVEMKLNPK